MRLTINTQKKEYMKLILMEVQIGIPHSKETYHPLDPDTIISKMIISKIDL